jgi:hypothetical protein
MSRFIAERDDEFSDQAVVVELSEDPDVNGGVVGYCVGPEAMNNAQEVADTINRTGRQPSERKAAGLGYTVRAGHEF